MSYDLKIGKTGNKYYYKDLNFHRDGDKPAVVWSDGSEYYYKNGELHRDGVKPAVNHKDGYKRYYKYGVKCTKDQVEKLEKLRTRIVNRIAIKCIRYWYDKTYSDTTGEAFQARMKRDMNELENEIGYKLD